MRSGKMWMILMTRVGTKPRFRFGGRAGGFEGRSWETVNLLFTLFSLKSQPTWFSDGIKANAIWPVIAVAVIRFEFNTKPRIFHRTKSETKKVKTSFILRPFCFGFCCCCCFKSFFFLPLSSRPHLSSCVTLVSTSAFCLCLIPCY